MYRYRRSSGQDQSNHEKIIKLGQKIIIKNRNSNFKFYPEKIFNQIKINDILSVGFDNLKIKSLKLKIKY